jgi:hypothetical protein
VDFVTYQLYEMFEFAGPGLMIDYTPPTRPHGEGANWLPDAGVYADEEEHWFLGQNWEASLPHEVAEIPFYWSQYHAGTDLGFGANAKLNGKQFFYMGDTLDADPDDPVRKWSEKKCDVGAGVRCDDMIVVSSDDDPIDGIDVSPVLGIEANPDTHLAEWRWTPVVIPGVHRDFSPYLNVEGTTFEYWDTPDSEPTYSAPTGAVVAQLPVTVRIAEPLVVYMPVLVLTYGTAIKPPGGEILDASDPATRPMSWMGCSLDGINFRACYRDADEQVVPFSADVPPPGTAAPGEGAPDGDPGAPARFIQIAAVEVNSSDLAGICASDPEVSPICEFEDSGGGLLLYGTGRPYRKSGLFLAFIPRYEFGQVDAGGKPIVLYWTGEVGDEWSLDEFAARSLTHDLGAFPPCDTWPQPNYDEDVFPHTAGCWPELQGWNTPPVFGEISARLVRSATDPLDSKVILLGNNDWSFLTLPEDQEYNDLRMVYAWRAPLVTPWAGDFWNEAAPEPGPNPLVTETAGYGPYIIDEFSDDTYPGLGPDGDIVLWHTISVWQGTVTTPYGVYTGSEVIPW